MNFLSIKNQIIDSSFGVLYLPCFPKEDEINVVGGVCETTAKSVANPIPQIIFTIPFGNGITGMGGKLGLRLFHPFFYWLIC